MSIDSHLRAQGFGEHQNLIQYSSVNSLSPTEDGRETNQETNKLVMLGWQLDSPAPKKDLSGFFYQNARYR